MNPEIKLSQRESWLNPENQFLSLERSIVHRNPFSSQGRSADPRNSVFYREGLLKP